MIKRGYEVKANDTICRQVSNRYEDLVHFAKMYDKIVFVSGKKSSNGKVLFEVCLKENPDTYFVSEVGEIDVTVFKEGDRVGICGATSTPMWLMKEVKAYLEAI
ncbi:4-hydroxy-3-methylbut-2-enyl diphosphate reductase [compost metagenome]